MIPVYLKVIHELGAELGSALEREQKWQDQ